MSKEARIFIIEDDKKLAELQKRSFESDGFKVIGTANTLEEARRAILNFEKEGVQVVTLDRQLIDGGHNDEGVTLAKQIRKQYPHIVLIGLSSGEFPNGIVDYDSDKSGYLSELTEYIINL